MAAKYLEVDRLCNQLVADARRGVFKPVYLLMGEEPYYVDMVCNAILENCIEEDQRDFNQIVCYGSDVNAEAVVTNARRFPMFSDRQLVVVKEAQVMKDLDEVGVYCENPLDSTVLVICMMGAKADKRRSLYKNASKTGVVVESVAVRDYELPGWIDTYYRSLGLKIAPDAAALLAEFAGMDLNKLAVETSKMLKNLPEGVTEVGAKDVEANVGISRQWSIFELSNALLAHNAPKALKIAANLGSSAKFAMPAATAQLYGQFGKLLRYEALLQKNPSADNATRASVLGISPYFIKDFDMAARWYPLRKTMGIIAALKEYDFKGKGGDAGEATPQELLLELVAKILA